MKTGIVNILLMISFAAGIIASGVRFRNSQTDIDNTFLALQGVKKYIVPGSILVLDWDRQAPDMIFKSRFVLAPVLLRLDTLHGQDTILSIRRYQPDNNEYPGIGKRVIWQQHDDVWDYRLITQG